MNFSDKFRETSEILSPMDSEIAYNIHARLSQAEEYFIPGKIGQAIVIVYEVIKAYPNFAQAYKLLGNLRLSQVKISQASRCYQTAIALDPQLAEALANLGSVAYQQGNFDQAIAYYQKVIELNPKFMPGYLALGELWENLEKWDEAIAAYINVLNIQFHESVIFHKLGNPIAKKGNLNDAQIFYSRNIPIQLFKKYSSLAQNWQIISKKNTRNTSINIDIYPRFFHDLSQPKTTEK